jgi:hypothetical protein
LRFEAHWQSQRIFFGSAEMTASILMISLSDFFAITQRPYSANCVGEEPAAMSCDLIG